MLLIYYKINIKKSNTKFLLLYFNIIALKQSLWIGLLLILFIFFLCGFEEGTMYIPLFRFIIMFCGIENSM